MATVFGDCGFGTWERLHRMLSGRQWSETIKCGLKKLETELFAWSSGTWPGRVVVLKNKHPRWGSSWVFQKGVFFFLIFVVWQPIAEGVVSRQRDAGDTEELSICLNWVLALSLKWGRSGRDRLKWSRSQSNLLHFPFFFFLIFLLIDVLSAPVLIGWPSQLFWPFFFSTLILDFRSFLSSSWQAA